jgi:hypothetical protein
MTVDELHQHPEYDHTIWSLKPEIKEKVAVAQDRGGPIDIAYEVHGHGPRHMVVSRISVSSSSGLRKQAVITPTFVMSEKIPQSY